MPINAHPEFLAAEKEYLSAQNIGDKIEKLKKMISLAPSHKGAENLRAELKTRLKILIEKNEKNRKKGKGRAGIKKEDMQAVLVGKANSGKSMLISALTNIHANISEIPFATKIPLIGMMNHRNVLVQIIEVPAIGSEYYDRGLVNTADLIVAVVDDISQIDEIAGRLSGTAGNVLIAFNKIDMLNDAERRKIEARLKSRKLNFMMISALTGENLNAFKEKIFSSFDKLRIFTKEPGRPKSEKPVIVSRNSDVKDVAEKILKGFSKNVTETKIWGPSSKFPGQKVGLNHIVKDMDIVEFKTR
jgi:ribosome-interacting GTPase 1